MEPSRRVRWVRVGLALHALGGAFLFVRGQDALAAMAFVVAVASAFLADTMLKRVAAVGAGMLMAALTLSISHRTLMAVGHLVLLLSLAVPSCIDAAGTSFREGRTRWLWLRAVLLLLALVITLGVWPAPHPSTLVPVLVVSHVLLRLGTAPIERAPLSLRVLAAMFVATVVCLTLAYLNREKTFEPSTFAALQAADHATAFDAVWLRVIAALPNAPYASLALAVASLAASLRIAPRVGLDGAVAALFVVAALIPVDMHDWWTASIGLAVAACWVATSVASRHVALRAFAGVTVFMAVWICERGAPKEATAFVVASVAFVAIAAAVAARPQMPRVAAAFVDPAYARLGALLHMAALALTVFEPTASLAALVPTVVFATRPLARFGSLALVTLAWATSALLASRIGLHDESAVALHAWAPWIMLAILEAARSRGHPLFVARLGVTVGALLFAIAAFNDRAGQVMGLLPGAIVVQAVLERAVGTVRPLPRVEPLAVVVAVPLLAGLAVFEFVMRWLVSKDGFYPYWDLHPITLFLIDGAPAVACVWLVAAAGLRRAMPFLAPGGAMLAAAGVALFAHKESYEHALAAVAVAMFCAGAVTRPPLARIAGVWCGIVAAMVVTLRGQLPRPDVIAEVGYPLWVILWFGALVAALVLSDAMRAAPLIAVPLMPAPLERAREPMMSPRL